MKTEDKAIGYADGIIENCQLDSSWSCEEIHWELRDAYLAEHNELQSQLKEALKELVDDVEEQIFNNNDLADEIQNLNHLDRSLSKAKKLLEQFK